jgi:CBS domain-containing protein
MTSPVITIPCDAELRDAFPLFRTHGVRRLAVVQDDGQFAGMITIDDLLIDLAADLADLARPVSAEVIFGDHIASVATTV